MLQKKYGGYLFGILFVLLGLYVIVAYNSLVARDVKVKETWSEVQSVYQRRLDLIPNLVSIVKGLSDFEQTTLAEVANARSKALSSVSNEITAESYKAQTKSQDELATAANKLIISVEKYPQLKGTAAYRGLQTQLEGTERRIKVARADFNTAIADYNQAVRSFPKNIVAKLLGFDEKSGFIADAGAEKNVEVKF